jgi:C-terminal processing protease CtpA/Prc
MHLRVMLVAKCRHDRRGLTGPATQAYAIRPGNRTRWRWTGLAAAGLACAPIHVPPTPGASPSIVGSTITRADALADLDTMMRVLEDVHPDLYAERPRDSVAAARQRLVAALPPSVTRGEFWQRLAPLAASLGDGHTSVYLPGEEVARMQAAGALVFPPSVAQDGAGRLVITAPLARNVEVEAGDRIVSINDFDADSLVRTWTNEVSGESNLFRVGGVTNGFRNFLLIHSIGAPYTLEIERSGMRRRAVLAGLTQDSLRALAARGGAAQRRTTTANFSYEKLSTGVGYMNFRSMAGDPSVFRGDVAKMFAQVGADSVQTLFIDLRGNGGGDSRLGEELLRHFTTKPYRMSAGKQWKMSAEYRAYFKTWVSAPLRWTRAWNFFPVGRQLMHGPDGKIADLPESEEAHSSADPYFAGSVCVLIGRQTFSSAVDLADAIKTYHLATLVGEETGGRPNGFGEAYVFRLPKSQLAVSVSSARFVRASGDTSDHRGVVPDIAAGPSELGASTLSIQARNCSKF